MREVWRRIVLAFRLAWWALRYGSAPVLPAVEKKGDRFLVLAKPDGASRTRIVYKGSGGAEARRAYGQAKKGSSKVRLLDDGKVRGKWDKRPKKKTPPGLEKLKKEKKGKGKGP
jgi:hypothetical protein